MPRLFSCLGEVPNSSSDSEADTKHHGMIPRLGRLSLCRSGAGQTNQDSAEHGSMDTPATIVTTTFGLPSHLTTDLLGGIPEARLLKLNVHEIVDNEGLKVFEGGVHSYLNINEWKVYMSTRNPHSSGLEVASDNALAFETPKRRLKVSTADYMAFIDSTKPELFQCMSEQVPMYAGKNKVRRAVDRTVKWIDSQVNSNRESHPIASIEGGCSDHERRRCARGLASKDVSGFVLNGLHLGEDEETRRRMVEVMLTEIPTDKMRVMSGTSRIEHVFEAVEMGMDLIESTYPHWATQNGHVLTFSFHANEATEFKLNLWDKQYKLDKRPFSEGCGCFACERHTRAYVHHLLHAHEMLADMLISVHNLYYFLAFVKEIRCTLQQGRVVYDNFKAHVLQQMYA